MPRTKIVATLGPASTNYTTLRKMVHAGLDVVRLNFSHGTHERHLEAVELVRRINRKYRRGILAVYGPALVGHLRDLPVLAEIAEEIAPGCGDRVGDRAGHEVI